MLLIIIFTRLIHRYFYFDRSGFESLKAFQPKLLIVLFYVLFCIVLCITCVCKCVLYYCHRVSTQLQLTNLSYHIYHITYYTGLFVSPSGISELDCATTKTDTAERSVSIGRESLQVFFSTRGLGVLPGSTARG